MKRKKVSDKVQKYGMKRRVDSLSRVSIPKEFRELFEIAVGDDVFFTRRKMGFYQHKGTSRITLIP